MAKSTREEAEMLLKWLSIVRSDQELHKAQMWMSTEFPKLDSWKELTEKFPVGSEGRRYFSVYRLYAETLGVLVHDGHFPVEFVLDALGGLGFSAKVKKIVDEWRKETNNPLMCENWEYLSQKVSAYLQERLKKPPRYAQQ